MVKTADRIEPSIPSRSATGIVERADWRQGLPLLRGCQIVLREIRTSDAEALMTILSAEEVSRFIWEPPSSVEVFETFVARSRSQRAAGACACYVVTLKGFDTAIGLFQIREVAPGFSTAEWGFAIGSDFWGTGVFAEAATLVLEFVFETLGSHRLEARSATKNGRGHAALRKVGAVQEGVLRKSLFRNGQYLDQVLYAIVAEEWGASQQGQKARIAKVH
jgi:RimJ/RimL family protein N-acetyltransferase